MLRRAIMKQTHSIDWVFALTELPDNQEIWVMTAEGAEITGYSAEYLQQMARKNFLKPEEDRQIRVRKRSKFYELWLPDILKHIEERGYGPRNPSNA